MSPTFASFPELFKLFPTLTNVLEFQKVPSSMSSVILKSMLAVALGWVRISVELNTVVSLLSIRHRETDETTLDALLELSD